LHVHAHANIY